MQHEPNHQKWEPHVRIDVGAPDEFCVVISDNIGMDEDDSTHTTEAAAVARAVELAKRLGCKWEMNHQ